MAASPVDYMRRLDAAPADGKWEPGPYVRRARWIRRSIWTVIVLTPLLMFANMAQIARNVPSGPTAATSQVTPGYGLASDSLSRWLAANPPPLPGGKILGWTGSVNVPVVPPPDGQSASAPKYTTTVHNFSVIDRSGVLYTASIQIGVDPRGGTAVIGGPSLIPDMTAISDGWASGTSPWPGITSPAETTEAIGTAVTAWAQAYTTGTPGALRLAVGDPSAEHTYLPLSGVSSVSARVVTLGALPSGKTAALARVELSVTWAGQPAPTAGSRTSVTPMVLDLLIERADSAAPVVTAWGAPGTGPTLSRYGNALTGSRVTPSAPPTSVTPTATATSTDLPTNG